ncbi:D-alanine--D-alanine ligase [Blastochloris viridis]|uniref:D-alanine--D-alanine ligase n=1 Tax=Blastochloris viridis TaxID=1079 RepID=A0A0H5B916_BLAVI|nr:D-alanine--D-alanine ligase [Blastochloris viridis]ALK08025.1 D-alanine--D-alanine ligase A [Blastochloris viridis]BAR98715.1 D-alanine--D-alanine ligase [Blastochloris viridis]CUU43947.1 D-alanine--D-alanine ligase A [Blastochloris viridis]
MKTRVAVLFGGRSPEHDVSIVTGLQVLDALDQGRFEAFPVYLSTTGRWFVGEQLRERSFYLPGPDAEKKLTQVTLDLTPNDLGHGVLLPKDKGGLFSRAKEIAFDVALPAFHGLIGEDGQIQGAFETANVPYTGMRTLASAVLMDKAATKRLLAETRIPLLPCEVIDRPATGMLPSLAALAELTKALAFPVIVKPAHLGSSIGVAKVATVEELRAVLPPIFKLDNQAIVEPFVENLVEYNIAVAGFEGKVRTSAVERPKRASDLLDFKQKYLSGGAKGGKSPGARSEGMLSLTRDINPTLPDGLADKLRKWAEQTFLAVGGTGTPRIDFLGNAETGAVFLNEVNPCPGSFAFFLWEAAAEPLLFTELLSKLIDEAIAQHRVRQIPADPTLVEARLFPRR